MSFMAPSERDIIRQVLDWLRLCRLFCWRQNSGAAQGVYKGRRRFVRFNSAPGMADVIATLPGGILFAIECKRPGRRPTPLQQAFLDDVVRAGGVSLVVSSLADLQAFLTSRGIRP
jgi:hypothetical protein